jgi:DNA (cytosine-5)-methyltransferase 1
MKVLDLFAGIGGFTLGLERAGFETVAFCEIEPYAQKVLKKHWPGVPIYDDVRQLTAERLAADGIGVDVITGGFPCQDISLAGRQEGIKGERSGLWSEIARLISELQPRYAIMENVTNLISGDRGRWFGRVLGDLAEIGYDAEWHCIPASAIGAHHHRDRIWIVAYPTSPRSETWSSYGLGDEDRPRGDSKQLESSSQQTSILLEDSRYGQWRDSESITARQDTQRKRERYTGTTERPSEDVADALYPRLQRGIHWWADQERQNKLGHFGCCGTTHGQPRQNTWDSEPDVGRVANGVPARSHRLKCLGNAVVPQIPELIGRAIMEFEDDRSTTL